MSAPLMPLLEALILGPGYDPHFVVFSSTRSKEWIYKYKLLKPLLEALILRPVYDPHLVGFFCSTCLKGCVYVWNFIFIYKISCINVYIILSWWILSLFSGVSCLVLSLSRCSSVTASKFAEELEECNDWWVKDIIFKQLGDTLIWRSSLCLFIYGYWRLLISMCPWSNVGYSTLVI